MNLNDYLIPDFDLTGNLTTEDTLYGLLSDDEEITGYLGLIEDIALSELSDVTLTSPVDGQVLKYDNGTWVNANESGGGSSDYNLLLNKPSINTVPLTGNKTTAELGLFSGDYDDLTNKPTLATVATTGNYNDLTNRPTIPAAQVNADWDAVAGVSQILNKPTIPAAQVNSDWDAVSGVEEILNKPTLATVATSGDYDDLINKPVEATEISVTASSDMPAGFPVPDVCRRGKVVIVRFNVNMPARTYLTTETIWNFSKKPVMVTNFIVTNVNGDTIPMFIHSTDGKIRISNQRTLAAASYFLGELVYLTDED